MFNKKKVVEEKRATPVTATPLSGKMDETRMRASLDALNQLDALNRTSPQELQQQFQQPQRKTYVDRKLDEATDILNRKKGQMITLQGEIQQCVDEATILQEIRDGKAVMYITDLLDMIDEYRAKDFDDQDHLLNLFEQELIQTTLHDLKLKKRI